MKYNSPDLTTIKSVLVAYPHPDDETFTVTGLTNKLNKAGAKTHLFVATKGEEGRPKTRGREETRRMRSIEGKKSAKIIGFDKLFHENFGDGQLSKKKDLLKKYLNKLIDHLNPDLLVTYDKSGLYGHPDHIALSEVVTEIAEKKKIRLWYSVMPLGRYKSLKLPTFMAEDKNFLAKRMEPNLMVKVGILEMVKKVRSLYAHKSQHYSFKDHAEPFPIWTLVLKNWNEYFHEVPLEKNGGHGGIRTRA